MVVNTFVQDGDTPEILADRHRNEVEFYQRIGFHIRDIRYFLPDLSHDQLALLTGAKVEELLEERGLSVPVTTDEASKAMPWMFDQTLLPGQYPPAS